MDEQLFKYFMETAFQHIYERLNMKDRSNLYKKFLNRDQPKQDIKPPKKGEAASVVDLYSKWASLNVEMMAASKENPGAA